MLSTDLVSVFLLDPWVLQMIVVYQGIMGRIIYAKIQMSQLIDFCSHPPIHPTPMFIIFHLEWLLGKGPRIGNDHSVPLAAIFKSLEDCRTDRTSWTGSRWAMFHLQVWSPKTGDVCRIPHSARLPKSSPQDGCWEAQQLFNISCFTPKILSLSSWFGTATWRIHGGFSPFQKHCHGCHGTMQH